MCSLWTMIGLLDPAFSVLPFVVLDIIHTMPLVDSLPLVVVSLESMRLLLSIHHFDIDSSYTSAGVKEVH